MSGLWGLFGRKAVQQPDNPQPGVGGYTEGPGPYGENGFPGSTSSTRYFKGASPRAVKIESSTNTGFEQGLSSVPQVRQQSSRGDIELDDANPRLTPTVETPQPQLTVNLQDTPGTFYGGQPDRNIPGYDLAGQNPLSGAQDAGGHSQRATTTPWPDANININVGGAPGSNNVRNTIAQDYKAVPGQLHTYQSASRPDQKGSFPGFAESSPVTVPSRYVYDDFGNSSWSVEREMPYGGRGDGARGADLNGTRYYATGQDDEFANAGLGQYGLRRLQGAKQPTLFAEPAPWSANNYVTTADVGTPDNPGPNTQVPNMVYVSPGPSASPPSTGRTG